MLDMFKTLFRHLWMDASDTTRAVPDEMLERLTRRVAASEQRHSGEIRLCVESSLPASDLWRLFRKAPLQALVRERALGLFGSLGVWDTEQNNGVLIYVLLAEHAIEIVADRGLTRHVAPAQWQAMAERMAGAFREQRYEDGLTQALEESSAVLMQHYALQPGVQANPNELPDTPLLR